MMQVTGFNLHYDVPDIDACVRFYHDLIGLPIRLEYEHIDRRGVIFAVSETVELECIGPPAGKPPRRPSPEGLRIKFRVDDVDAEYERLTAAGIELIESLRDQDWGERSFALRSPDGLSVFIYSERERA